MIYCFNNIMMRLILIGWKLGVKAKQQYAWAECWAGSGRRLCCLDLFLSSLNCSPLAKPLPPRIQCAATMLHMLAMQNTWQNIGLQTKQMQVSASALPLPGGGCSKPSPLWNSSSSCISGITVLMGNSNWVSTYSLGYNNYYFKLNWNQ